jgi:hypothetical protein
VTPLELERALARARDLLADPERVVLNPMHYLELGDGREYFDAIDVLAEGRRATCRVCMFGAAALAAFECGADERDVEAVLTAKAMQVGVEVEDAVDERWGDDPSRYLTSALIQGRAVEVCDAALADVRAGVEIDTSLVEF